MKNTEYVTRWVVTIPCKHMNGFRRLAHPQQGRFTFATEEEAKAWVADYMEAGLPCKQRADMKVMPCPCYPGHFDPARVWFRD